MVPVGPRIPITSLMDGYERSWFDNLSTSAELREEDEEDVYGIEKVRCCSRIWPRGGLVAGGGGTHVRSILAPLCVRVRQWMRHDVSNRSYKGKMKKNVFKFLPPSAVRAHPFPVPPSLRVGCSR